MNSNNNGFHIKLYAQFLLHHLFVCDHSGSFVDDLSGENRIVITSSTSQELAAKGLLIDDDNICILI